MERDLLPCAIRALSLSLPSARSPSPVAKSDRSTGSILSLPAPLPSGRWPTCFWDLPRELRQMIYQFACPGYYVDISHVDTGPSFTRAHSRLRAEYLERHHGSTTFMLHVRNVLKQDRAWIWRDFIGSMRNSQAGHLENLVFYFPSFVLKVHIAPRSPQRLSHQFIADYGDAYDKTVVLNTNHITKLVNTWIETCLKLISARCQTQRFTRKDINRIAKIPYELVPFLHMWLFPRRFPDHRTRLDGLAEHAWDCQECSWSCEMLD